MAHAKPGSFDGSKRAIERKEENRVRRAHEDAAEAESRGITVVQLCTERWQQFKAAYKALGRSAFPRFSGSGHLSRPEPASEGYGYGRWYVGQR
jgi:hypothetical protein